MNGGRLEPAAGTPSAGPARARTALAGRLGATDGQLWTLVIGLVVAILLALFGLPPVVHHHHGGPTPVTTVGAPASPPTG
jgi:hypothetical protein